jgi:adenine-specific DNA-methyltransferase
MVTRYASTMIVPGDAHELLDGLLAHAEARRVGAAQGLSSAAQRAYGQFFTPREVAERIAAQPRLDQFEGISILDPGAGAGILTAALVSRVLRERRDLLRISVTAVEVDQSLHDDLRATMADCERVAAAMGVAFAHELVTDDFISWGVARCIGNLKVSPDTRLFDVVVQNPPYGKVARSSPVRDHLARIGVDVPNIYAAFLAVSAHLLGQGGQLTAITPRSFCNGAYFRPFRRKFLESIGIDRICVFHERGTLFAESSVLQETIILSGTRGARPDKVVIASSRGYLDVPHERPVSYEDLLAPGDPEMFLRIPTDADDDLATDKVAQLPARLADLGLQVSTGRVVDFRAKEFLRFHPEPGTVPLVYPHHLRNGGIAWPARNHKKPNALRNVPATEKLLLPAGTYVLVKRLSSKEEPRRIVACVFYPEDTPSTQVGFENHLNVILQSNGGLDPLIAVGLAVWLNSSVLDRYFRQFSGHTQVNAIDLRNMYYPGRESLVRLGIAATGSAWPSQDEIDELVSRHVFEDVHPTTRSTNVAERKIASLAKARDLLRALNFDAERSNERSALVLLSLAHLRPDQSWVEATNPMLRTVEIMDFLREHHGRDYAPNTRETIRRQTLHQFVEAGLVVQNPDRPNRPVNSPRSCYQLANQALEIIRDFGLTKFEKTLRRYLADQPGLRDAYAAERSRIRIPVTLPDGQTLAISPGGQNELIRKVVEEFCPYYTPGGQILYVGDADQKWQYLEHGAFATLGVVLDEQMPDLVVYVPDRNWLVLIEAVSSHGPLIRSATPS